MMKEIPFVGDVRKNQSVYLSEPAFKVPRYSGRGAENSPKRILIRNSFIINGELAFQQFINRVDIR